jgi:hypothetical protein
LTVIKFGAPMQVRILIEIWFSPNVFSEFDLRKGTPESGHLGLARFLYIAPKSDGEVEGRIVSIESATLRCRCFPHASF